MTDTPQPGSGPEPESQPEPRAESSAPAPAEAAATAQEPVAGQAPPPPATPGTPPPYVYPPPYYPPRPSPWPGWRRAWVPGLIGLLIGGALGAGITAAAEHHRPDFGRNHVHHRGAPPGGYFPGPRFQPQPGNPRRNLPPGAPGPVQPPTPKPTTSS